MIYGEGMKMNDVYKVYIRRDDAERIIIGQYMIWTDGKTYRCIQNTDRSPDEVAQAWEAVTIE